MKPSSSPAMLASERKVVNLLKSPVSFASFMDSHSEEEKGSNIERVSPRKPSSFVWSLERVACALSSWAVYVDPRHPSHPPPQPKLPKPLDNILAQGWGPRIIPSKF